MQAAVPSSSPNQAAESAEAELILPPLRTVAVLVTGITGFLLAAIFAAHWVAGPGRASPANRTEQGRIVAPARGEDRRDAAYPYTDPATIGLY